MGVDGAHIAGLPTAAPETYHSEAIYFVIDISNLNAVSIILMVQY